MSTCYDDHDIEDDEYEDEEEEEEEDEDEDEYCGPTCDNCGERYDEDDAYAVIVCIAADGSAEETVTWCPDCTSCDAFYCNADGEYYTDSSFTIVFEWGSGESLCEEYVTKFPDTWFETVDGEYIHTEDYTTAQQDGEAPQLKEKKVFADFYWKMPSGKSPVGDAPLGGRILVLMNDDGGEVSSDKNGTLAGYLRDIHARIADAGADPGDPDTVNVYTRLVLIDKQLLPASYRL